MNFCMLHHVGNDVKNSPEAGTGAQHGGAEVRVPVLGAAGLLARGLVAEGEPLVEGGPGPGARPRTVRRRGVHQVHAGLRHHRPGGERRAAALPSDNRSI